ncbi:MAG: SH3 domain-containing protein [Anaerolineae bacterium]|jgi:hypothetical protein
MAKEAQRYDVGAIRDLLHNAFTAEEFRDVLYFAKTAELKEVSNQFAPGDSYPTMVRKAVRYCDSHYLLCELLAEVKEANPRAFEQFEGRLRVRPAAAPLQERPKWLVPLLAAGAAVIVILVAVVLVMGLRSCDGGTPTPTTARPTTPPPTMPPPTETFTPAPTDTPVTASSTPMLTVVPQAERKFVVAYTGVGTDNYVTLRQQPTTSSASVARVYAGDRLVVTRLPVTGSGSTWWPVRTEANVEGWVVEWFNGYRLIKPSMKDGETVAVVRENTPLLRNEDCGIRLYLSAGTLLTVEDEPDRSKCDKPGDDSMAGREWWMVRTADGELGWVADFDIQAYAKPMLIAPIWYADLTGQ